MSASHRRATLLHRQHFLTTFHTDTTITHPRQSHTHTTHTALTDGAVLLDHVGEGYLLEHSGRDGQHRIQRYQHFHIRRHIIRGEVGELGLW